MSKINHDIRSNQGRTIYMPEYYSGEVGWGNLFIPNIYAADGDAISQYPRGTKLVMGSREFLYGNYKGQLAPYTATSITATNGDDLFGKFLFTSAIQQDMANSLLVRHLTNELSSVYQTTVDDGGRADDWFSGGWMNGKDTAPSDARHYQRRIVKHGYAATGSKAEKIWNVASESDTIVDLSAYSNVSVLELEQAIVNSKTSMATTLTANPWKNVIWQESQSNAQYNQAMGACMVNDIIATRNCWFQTKGPMACHHIQNANTGAGNWETIYYIKGDGSIQGIDGTSDTYGDGEGQVTIAGYRIGSTLFESGSGQDEGLPMIFVTLGG